MSIVLWHIAISHYSEKARWALDHKRIPHTRRTPFPGAHMAMALWMTRGRHFTFPMIQIDGRVVGDSSALIATLEERFPDPPLYPEDPDDRRRALELEDYFDEELGPAIRSFAFHHLRDDPAAFNTLVEENLTGVAAKMGSLAGRYGRAFTAARYRADDSARAEAAKEKVVGVLDRLERELDGGEFLVGNRFGVADLTAAALFYPMVLPPEGPLRIDKLPAELEDLRESFEGRAGYRWVGEIYRRFRHCAEPYPSHS